MTDPETYEDDMEMIRDFVAAWYERDHDRAKNLIDSAKRAETVGESQKLANEARRHLARAEAFQAVLKLIGAPQSNADVESDPGADDE